MPWASQAIGLTRRRWWVMPGRRLLGGSHAAAAAPKVGRRPRRGRGWHGRKLLCKHVERARNEAGDAIGVRAGAPATDQPGEGVQAPGGSVPLVVAPCDLSAAGALDAPSAPAQPIPGTTRELLEGGGDRVEAEHARPALAGALRGKPAGEAGELGDGAGLVGEHDHDAGAERAPKGERWRSERATSRNCEPSIHVPE